MRLSGPQQAETESVNGVPKSSMESGMEVPKDHQIEMEV